MGLDVESGHEVALKLESQRHTRPQLQYEEKVYRVLQGGVGVPLVHWFGCEGDYNVLVLDLLGPSLEDLFCFCHRKMSLKTVLMLADQMICRVEWLHSKGLLHRDMKPDNFVIGLGRKANHVHLIDYGLAKRYIDPVTKQHIPYREDKNLTGTARYASLNTHLGLEQSRRDDLEALGNVLVYLVRGSLPWQGLHANNKKDKYEKVRLKKLQTSSEALCWGLPPEFCQYLNYCKGLGFEEKPNYKYLRRLFRDLFAREGYELDYVFDWALLGPSVIQATILGMEQRLRVGSRFAHEEDEDGEEDDDRGAF